MAENQSERREALGSYDYLRIVRERWWIIVLCVVILVGASLFVSLRAVPLYETSANLIQTDDSLDATIVGSGAYGSYYYTPAQIVTKDLAVLTIEPSIAEAVKAQLNSARDAGQLASLMSVRLDIDTQVITISGRSTDPNEAAAVANAFADQFIFYRQETDRASIASGRDLLQGRIDRLTPTEKESDYGLMMQEKYESLLLLESIQDGGYSIIRRAAVPGAPLPPRMTRNLLLAAGLGLVLGTVLVFLIALLDKRVKDEKTLEQVSGLPVLTSVPVVGRRWKTAKRGERQADPIGFQGSSRVLLESFRTLRSSLQYFSVDGDLRTILVTSALPQEGKTTATINLALSLALSGKRVIILDADLRRPMVHEYLNLEDELGLSAVLAGKSSVCDALQMVPTDPFMSTKTGNDSDTPVSVLRKNLYCLPSGPLPPNPAELLASARMGNVVAELKGMTDYLLIDSPPVLPVSDALILAQHVDGVILTTRLRAITRDDLVEARVRVDRTGARVIGLVADGVKRRNGYYGKRGYVYEYGSH